MYCRYYLTMRVFLIFLDTWVTVLTFSFGQNENEYKNATLNETSSSPYPYYEEYFKEVSYVYRWFLYLHKEECVKGEKGGEKIEFWIRFDQRYYRIKKR